MALIECKNCGNRISDKAVKCPHCGTEHVSVSLQEVQNSRREEEGRFEESMGNISLPPDKPKKKKTPVLIFCVLGVVIVLALLWFFTYAISYDDYSSSTDVAPIAREFSDGKFFLCEESENGPLSIYVIDNDNWVQTIKVVWMQPWEEKHHGQLDKFTYTIYDDEVAFSSNDARIGTKDNMVIYGEASGIIDKSNNLTLIVGSKTYIYPNLREASEMEVRETFGKYEN